MATSTTRNSLNFCFPQSTPTSFTDLLATSSDDYSGATTKGLGERIAERTGGSSSGVPKFKSFPPPSLPLSPPPVSPSSYFNFPLGLSPTMLLDSPVLLYGSNILPSPTTGNVSAAESFNWKNDFENFNQRIKREDNNNNNHQSDFCFPSQSESIFQGRMNSSMQDSNNNHQQVENTNDANSYYTFSPETATLQNDSANHPTTGSDFQHNHQKQQQPSLNIAKTKSGGDGYNWRKYGQKQVKGSANPRSYYKCTYPNCLTRKILEKSLDGHISQIVYKGNHNHPLPPSKKRSQSGSSNSSLAVLDQTHYGVPSNDSRDPSYGSGGNTADNSSISVGDDDFGQSSEIVSRPNDDEEESQAKRWKSDGQNEDVSGPRCRTIREPRVVVQTTSEIDILEDGFRWRKYGQKAVRANPNPRSYYKCTYPGCPVRKHVERASDNPKSVITTYEGKHTHDVPAARGTAPNTHSLYRPSPTHVNNNNNNTSSVGTSSSSLSGGNNQVPYTLQMLQNPY